MLRKSLIAVFAVVALVAVAAVALFAFVDANRFKPLIEQAAQDRLHRRLAIDGDLALSVFPRLALRLPRTTLYDRGGKEPLLSLESARVGVALLPLLGGRAEVDRVRVDGLSLRLRRSADGSTNIDDLLHPERATPAEPQNVQAKPVAFDIGSVELEDAEVQLIEPDGTTTLTKLNLRTGHIAPGAGLPIRASTQFALPSKIAGEARLAAELTFDPARHAYGVENATMTLKGVRAGEDFEAELKATKLQLAADAIRADPIALTLKRGGSAPAEVTLKTAAFDGSARALRIDRIELGADLRQGARHISAALASPAQVDLDARTLALPQLAGDVTFDDAAPGAKPVKLALTAELTLDAARQSLQLRADTSLDGGAINAKVDVAGFSRPRIGFDVHADRLDLDRFNPPAAPAGKPTAGGVAAQKIDLSALRALDASGQVAIGELQARGLKSSNVHIALKAANGRADLAPIAAQLYGGSLAGSARASADGNRVGLDATLSNVAVGPLLKDVLKREPLEGRGTVRLALATDGATVDAMKRALDGNASLRIRDGAVRGIDLVRKLRAARALITGGGTDSQRANAAEKTDFSELAVSFAIKDGVASSDDLDLKSPLAHIGGAGRIDLAAGTMDYTARVSPTAALADLRGIAVPVRLAGPFDELTYRIDWGGVARSAVQSTLIDQSKKKLEERAVDALKGLLGR